MAVPVQHQAEAALVYATCPDAQTAQDIGRALVAAKLAACVNILPGMTSVYRWDGDVTQDNEVVLIIKTRKALIDQVIAEGVKLHPYETPAFLAVDVVSASPSYLAWILAETKDGEG
ncbi:MAG: divalent-cation tolerance protein CutA [Pseudomonadota bacterium]